MQGMKNLLASASCFLTMLSIVESARGESHSVRSEDGGDLAYVVRRGEGAISLAEIRLVSKMDNRPGRIRAYPGEPGDLFLDPAGEGLINLERSLRREAWGSYFYGGQSLPITNNRMGKLSLDGAEITEARFTKGGLNVVPMPSRTYKKGQSVFVYCEIYNLSEDEFGQTNYSVSYKITSKDAPGRGGKHLSSVPLGNWKSRGTGRHVRTTRRDRSGSGIRRTRAG